MHDVITKTLPADGDALKLRRECDAATMLHVAQRQDSAMIEADLSRGAGPTEQAPEDPLVFAVSDAITALREHMFECAIDEVQNTGRRDPDYSRADAAEAHLLKAIDALIASRIGAAAPAVCDPVQVDNGLLTSHNPDRRLR